MSVLLLGQTGVVVMTNPHTGRTCRYWAEHGVIHYEDSKDDGAYGQISDLREALERVYAINQMLGRSSDPGIEIDPQQRAWMQDYVEKMIGLIRQAKDQGNPQERLRRLRQTTLADMPKEHRQRDRVKIPVRFFM